MPVNIPALTTAASLNAATLNDIFLLVEKFLNGGMDSTDIDTSSEWIESRHVVKPDFFGAPAPRVHLTSSDVHIRERLNNLHTFVVTNDMSNGFIPIPGLSASFYVDLNADEADTCFAIVNANFFCLEKEAVSGDRNSGLVDDSPNGDFDPDDYESSSYLAGIFALFVNGSEISSTRRNIYANYDGFAFKNHSISAMIELSKGMNDVSIRIKPSPDEQPASAGNNKVYFYQIMIRERNMNIEVLYR
tara:strand:- start:2090 stop:2827 length:738 start_codon:yes stop_codon:yes gene_type:complete